MNHGIQYQVTPLGVARPVLDQSVLYTLPGLFAAFSADQAVYSDSARTTPITEGGSCRGWADLTGNGRHLRDGAALFGGTNSPPVWSASSFGGKPGLAFDGANTALHGLAAWTLADSLTLYFVIARTSWSTSSTLQYLAVHGFSAVDGVLVRQNWDALGATISAMGDGYNGGQHPSVIGATQPGTSRVVLTVQLAATGTVVRVNGASAGGTATNAALPSYTDTFYTGMALGPHSLLNGTLAALWIYSGTPHDSTQLAAAEAQLTTDWGI